MNKTYKVIYNRTRCMYQVVSELAKGHTKSETPEMLKSLFSKHSGLTRGIVMAVLSMSLAMPVGVAVQAEETAGTSGNTTSTSDTTTSDSTNTATTAADTNLSNLTETGKGVITTEATAVVNTAINSKVGSLDANGNYIQKDVSVSSNLSTLDTQVKTNADAISKETTDREAAVTSVTNSVSSLSDSAVKYDVDSSKAKVTLAGAGGTTITNVKDGALSESSTDAVTGKQLYAEQTARTAADTDLTNKIGSLSDNGNYIQKNASVSSNLSLLDTQVKTNTSDITGLKNLSNVSDAGKTVIKEQAKQAVKVAAGDRVAVTPSGSETGDGTITYTVTAKNDGVISNGDTNLVSGGTLYTELRPASTGTYYYISNANTTAANLIALDTNLKNVIDAIGLDADDTTTSYTSKLNKYFKVNPEVTTSSDGKTKNYAPDAAANGTNSVAIGPSAQSGEKSTDATTSTTTVTGGTSSTAIGDSAVANGDQSVALGYNSQVLNAAGSTTAVSGSTAIGNDAKVEGGSDSTALGTDATVDTASNAMALGKSATINKTATSGVAIGNGAVTGSEDTTKTVNNVTYTVKAAGGVDSVAIGTSASSAGNTSVALGKGATVENDTDGNYQAVVKSDDIAIGTGAKTSASDSSTAIGKSATVSQSTDAMAIGSSASVGASSNDAMALGKGATVGSGATDSIAMGTSAKTVSADTIAIGQNTSATGANSVVIGKGATTTVEGGNAIGSSSTASGYSTAIGQSATANNYNAVAIGNGATANADRSIALGYNAGVGTSEGKGETQNAGSLIAIGTSSGNNVSGMQNVAIGENAGSNVKSSYNVAIGSQAGYGINYASDDKSQNGYNVSIGYKANYQADSANIMYSTALGNEANALNYSVAVGNRAKAGGAHTVAIGEDAQTSDASSIALGQNASAADGNIAIGNGSSAPAVSSLGDSYKVQDGYVYKSTTTTDSSGTSTTTLTELKSAFTYKPLASDSHYISVGNSTLTRRISNVADGVFDSDAATVGQLNSLNELLQATDTKVGLTKDYFEQKFTNLNTTIDASKTKYFSVSTSSDNLTANADNTGAVTSKADAMAIGPNANATNVKSLAVGNNVYANGLRSIAIGTAPNPIKDAEGNTTTHNTSADGENSIALGTSTTAKADNSIAIGTRAQTYTTDTTSNTGVSAVAIGNLATTAGNQSVALGYNATVKYNYGTAIGAEALASGTDAVAIGKGNKAYSTDSTAVGQDNSITGNNVYGLGSSNNIGGNWNSIIQSGVSGYKNMVTSVSDQDTTNALTGVYMTGSKNKLNQNVKDNVMQDITVQGNSNTIDGGAGGTSGHQNTLSQIAIVGFSNTVQGKSSDDSKTNNIKDVTILGYNNTVDANKDTTVDFSNTQILGNNVTATLGNSVYLGNNAAYVQPTAPAQDAIDAAKTAADTAAEASDAYKAATTDEDKATIKAEYEAKYLYKLKVQAMEAKGSTAGMNSYDTDETYGNGTSYTYAGSNPTGVVTVGTASSERRIQNVAAGLVSATSTDAVNGSQLYALTRQLRFGGDNSTFGTTTADDKEVVARGSNEALSIIGGETDTTKLTDNNVGVVADSTNNTLTVKLASDLKKLNTASLGSGSGDSYKETIKLDGTNGKVTAADTSGTVKTTLDTTGLTIANGPKFTSNGIDAASQKITSVKDGEADTDAANYGQVKAAAAAATTEVKAGTNASLGTVETSATDKHKIYTVNVDNLAVKANGTGTTTVELAKGINFKDGTNTTATVGADGTVTISATHNKLSTVSAATGDKDNVTLTLTDADGNTVTSTGLKNTYTTVTKDGTAHTVTFARNDGTTETLSLGDLDGASKGELATAAAKATSEVTNGTNVASVRKTTGNNGQNIYTVNVDDLAVKTTSGEKKSVHLADGLVFADGTNTTATVGDNGTIKFNVPNNAIRKQAVQAITVQSGSNVTVTPATNADGTLKTFTISASHNALKSATLTPKSNDVSTLTITGNDGDTASVDIKNTHLTVSKDSTAKTVTFTSNDGTTPATTLSLSDFGAASTTDMTAAVAKATTEVKAGTNATLGTLETDPTDQHKIYTVNVDNLGLKQNGTTVGTGKGVSLKNGLNFTDGTNTTASVAENGTVSYSISNDAIKAQAKDAVVVKAGDNVSIDNPTDANNVKTYTVRVNNLQLQADGVNKATRKLADGINFAGGTNTTADVTADGKVTYNLKDSISLNQVQTGDSTLNTNGLTITNGPIFTKNKIDANNQQITNVASGGDVATNAATIGDLNSAIQKASEGTTASGFKTKGNYGDAVTSRLDKQLNVLGDVDTTKVAEQNLSNGNVGVVTSTDNAGNATLTVKLNKDINLGEKGSVTTGNTVMNDAGITNGNMSLGANGLTIKDSGDTSKIKVAVTDSNVTMGGNVIHNVGNGVEPTDAVNKSQLDDLQKQVTGGWNLAGKNAEGTAVTAQIGAGETVTYNNGNYTKSVVTKDDNNNATVKVDVTTGTFGSDAGKATSVTNGLATTGAVANAVNNASWTIQDGNHTGNAQQIKAGDTVSLKAGDNLSLDQNGKEFTYKLNKTLQNMTSVTAVDNKQNTAVLNGEGLKVSDKEGDSLTQHATEVRLHSATAATEDTSKDVVLNNAGLTVGNNIKFTNTGISAGNQKITNVANGEVQTGSKEAVNGGQLYELQQKVTNGWKITGNDTTKASNIGNDKTVSFVNGNNSYIKAKVDATNTGATVSYTAQTASLTKNADGKATLTGTTDGLVTGTNLTSVLNSLSWTAQSSQVGTGQNNGSTAQSITAGSQVGFIAGDNMILTQDGTNFTYALNPSLTGMNTIAFTGLGTSASNLIIGLQNGGGANPDKGYYITGLSNTKWDQSNYDGTRAATEAQLREAIDKVSAATGTGGFGLTADEGANNGGEKKVSQTLGSTIAIQGDGTYDAEGKVVKQGNISTVAYTDNAGPTGAIKVKLNKDIDLSEAGSLTIGASKVSSGSIVLGNMSDAAKKIVLNSTTGTASIGGVTVNGTAKTVMGLANTTWDGTTVSGRAATEDQLAKAISDVSTQASNSELHIRKGTYGVGKDQDGQDVADPKGKNSVSIDVVNAKGVVDGQVVINDVAKASEVGTVGELADNLKNPAGGSTTVVQAVNKVNQKVDESLKTVNGDITNAVTEAKKHTEVQSVDSDNNVAIDGTTTNADGGTIYKLGLNKQHLNLGNVHVYGNEGRVTAKTVESETVKIDDQTRLDKTGLTTGNTTVANNRIVVGGDNGIKIEANGGQQTISGLTNTDWTGTAVHGRAATEDQLAKAISSATTTAAQNEQHIKAGTYDIQTTTDDKGNKHNSVTMDIVDGTGKDKGTVVINDVAKASDVGDTDKLAADIKNQNGGQPQTTSVVEAVNNLNEKVNTRVGDNKYSAITSKDAVQDGDNSTTAIAKLNNRMTDIYHNATQHSSVAVDGNLTLDDKGINKSGGTEYKIGLNKDQINLGNLTIKGNEGSIEAKSIKSDSFTAGDTVVNKDGVKVGDKSALTGDSLKVGGDTYVDKNGLNANNKAIHNVGEGKEDGDAVNRKQLNEVKSDYQAADAKLADAIQQTDAGLNEVGRAVNKLGNRLNRVGAGAAALAALHPGTYDPNDKWDFSAGIGHYHDANAVAIGAYYHPNDTTILSIGGSMGGGENMVNAGITWKMGRSGREQAAQPVVVRKAEAAPVVQQAAPVRPAPVVTPVPAVTPAPVTTPAPVKSVAPAMPVQAAPAVTTPMTPAAPSNDTAALAQILARQTAILEKLAQNQSQAAPSAAVAHGDDIFPDVPDNHWAYAYVAKLEKAGALKGFKRPAVLKSPMMTRDDFASVLYTAMANGATTNPALNGDDSLNRLAQEFKAELKNVKA
ncbi:MAG: ESPR-type extended signal peptide-containing protein [Megasphaera sp.]|uniref:ESPR-type extended signal peptide-containing protein n=1 Tax=Megasphaera sp. TaxID=2023260 RepID=UPI003F0E4F91